MADSRRLDGVACRRPHAPETRVEVLLDPGRAPRIRRSRLIPASPRCVEQQAEQKRRIRLHLAPREGTQGYHISSVDLCRRRNDVDDARSRLPRFE